MEWLLSFCVGVGLSAACGFRVFVPMLAMSIASQTGHLSLGSGFEWIGSPAATVAFGAATVLEVGGYFVPWVDNLLDTVATPAAMVAGTVATASMVGDISPALRWPLAVVAGGGAAGVVQGATVITRGLFTATTAGAGNPGVAAGEDAASVVMSVLAILIPVLAAIVVAVICVAIIRRLVRRKRSKSQPADAGAD
jgi:hypothetical protein